MYDICCIGHITLDKVVTTVYEKHMAGGTSFYFSNAINNMDVNYGLVTAIATKEMQFVKDLRAANIDVKVLPSKHTVYFENIYSHNMDHRTQRVLQIADPFTVEQLNKVNAGIFHLGPLLADDMPLSLIADLSSRGKVSLDVQGYLRKVNNYNVCAIDWKDKLAALKYIDILKANDAEMEIITGEKDVKKGAILLNKWGVKEVVITLGSRGSVVYADGNFYIVPAYKPSVVIDATGCGDTYMAGYLYQRSKGAGFQFAGEFAAAMASLKIQSSGPFKGTEKEVLLFLDKSKSVNSYNTL